MVLWQISKIVLLVFQFPHILSQSLSYTDTCKEATFYRRPEMDDLVFTESLIEEMNQVDMKAECFSRCQRLELCNLVLYNPVTRKCRLYTEVFGSLSDGTVETGWQYHGISCANFRLDNAHADVDVINTVPKDVCHSNIIVAADNTSSCCTGASWELVPVKCVSCYHGTARQTKIPSEPFVEELPFDLAAGMKLRLEVSGDTSVHNNIYFEDADLNLVYLFSVRWSKVPTQAVFNTRQGGVFSTEEVNLDVSVSDINNYVMEIHINESAFMTYVDGALWMTNQMRLPLIHVRRVYAEGFTALRSFRIGYELC